MSVRVNVVVWCNVWVMNMRWGRVKGKPGASISLLSYGRMEMHCGGNWDMTQIYLGRKLAVEVLLRHPTWSHLSLGKLVENCYPARDLTRDRCVTAPTDSNWCTKGGKKLNTFKYHVSCTDVKISVTINLLFYLFFHRRPIQHLLFLSCRYFVVNTTFSTGLEGVENVVLTMKGLQERNTEMLDRTTVEK